MRPALFPLLLALGCAAAPPPRALGAAGGSRAREVRVTILSTMLAEAGIGEWGFAALVEVDGRRILFDTGERPRTVLENARELELDLASVPEVVLSHHHGDHTGGLLTLRDALAPVSSAALATAHVGRGLFAPRLDRGSNGEENPMIAARRPTRPRAARSSSTGARRSSTPECGSAGRSNGCTPSGTGAATGSSCSKAVRSRTRSPKTWRS